MLTRATYLLSHYFTSWELTGRR